MRHPRLPCARQPWAGTEAGSQRLQRTSGPGSWRDRGLGKDLVTRRRKGVDGQVELLVLHSKYDVTEEDLSRAASGLDNNLKPSIEVSFINRGARKMSILTGKYIDRSLTAIIN